jgi:histidyl-tRNA synthetase
VAGREGQQQALGGGGRYDGLAELLGGRPTPGIGFGLGIDRVLLALTEQGSEAPEDDGELVVVVSADPGAMVDRLRVASVLREANLRVRPDGSSRRLGRQLESAAKLGSRWAVIVGDELQRDAVVLRDLASGEQRELDVRKVAEAVTQTAEA